ncbi:MAG: histidine--tRNA ligase [Aureispira sp.]|nr:histidine--tRNA ligase [Aureispira sp.]
MKPEIVQGTRDFSPQVVNKRNYIFNTLRNIFEKYGYQAIETPTMERLSTLTGKYGDEGDQLLFKVLNNGDYLKKANKEALENLDSKKLMPSIAKRGLRYDLTVPFARYVVMNRNDIAFPFKRYQIQPVWRADRPQRGRYREFYQCDVDVIGSKSLLYEAELIQIYDEAFAQLGLEVVIRVNNRKILEGLAAYAGYPDSFVQIVTAIDKLDKIGWDGVKTELEKFDVDENGFQKIRKVIDAKDLMELSSLFEGIEVGQQGVQELNEVQAFLDASNYTVKNKLAIDFSLARGLSYYTGGIFEVVVDISVAGQEAVKMGSIGGGGRYADLTGMFGLKDMSGVGVSFGADRIYDVLDELNLFKDIPTDTTQVLVLTMDEESLKYGFGLTQQIRAAGINADIYPEVGKFKKLMKYANRRGIPYVIIIGEQERTSQELSFKEMETGAQSKLTIENIIAQLSN